MGRIKLLLLTLCCIFYLNNHQYELGRDKDPRKESEISYISLLSKKIIWETLSLPGMRFMVGLNFPKSTITHFDTQNAVAFTIDDGFCGLDNPDGDMTKEVRELFKKYNAHATFFITGSHCSHTKKEEIQLLLKDGHEIANHSMLDTPYNKYTTEEFKDDFEMTNKILLNYTQNIPNWYRAPHGKLSKNMQSVINEKGYKHIVCDGFANDTAIPDPEWIAKFILKKIKPGSIILIHMPERDVREWNYKAMELVLQGLKSKNLDILNLSEINQINKNR